MTEEIIATIALPHDIYKVVGIYEGLYENSVDLEEFHAVEGYNREVFHGLMAFYKIYMFMTKNQPEAYNQIDCLINEMKALYKTTSQKLDIFKEERNAIVQKEEKELRPNTFFVVEFWSNGVWKTLKNIFYSRKEAQKSIDFMADNYDLIMKDNIKRYRIVKRTLENPDINKNVVIFP